MKFNGVYPPAKMLQVAWNVAVLSAILALVWMIWPYAVSAWHVEQAGHAQSPEEAVPHLHAALKIEPHNTQVLRQLARLDLSAGRPTQALTTLGKIARLRPHNPLIQLELGDVYDRLGNVDRAIAHYEAGLVGNRGPQLTVNYLQQADQLWAAGHEEAAVAIWRDKVRGTGYGDLYANWRLARYYAGDEEAAVPYREAAHYFSLESIAPPPDPRLTAYQAQAILGVVEDGLWPRETLLNVVSYRVWQDQTEGAEELLQTLTTAQPADPDLRFYLGELYHRRGDWAQAEATYRQVLDIDPGYAQAYLRLGMVAEAKCELRTVDCEYLTKAAGWYEQYRALAPDDLLGLKKQTELAELLQQPQAGTLRAELNALTDDWRIVAEMLGVAPEAVTLGSNLVQNGDFEAWEDGQPVGWRLGEYLGPGGDKGLYVAGKDTLVPDDTAARIITFWGGTISDGTTTYAEYVGTGVAISNSKYLVSLDYRSSKFLEGNGFVFLGEYTHKDGIVLLSETLPHFANQWRRFLVVVDGPTVATAINPLVRVWGSGNLIIQSLSVRPFIHEQ